MTNKFSMLDNCVGCTGKKDTDKDGHKGTYYGWLMVGTRKWAIVKWDLDADPDLYKANHLLVSLE